MWPLCPHRPSSFQSRQATEAALVIGIGYFYLSECFLRSRQSLSHQHERRFSYTALLTSSRVPQSLLRAHLLIVTLLHVPALQSYVMMCVASLTHERFLASYHRNFPSWQHGWHGHKSHGKKPGAMFRLKSQPGDTSLQNQIPSAVKTTPSHIRWYNVKGTSSQPLRPKTVPKCLPDSRPVRTGLSASLSLCFTTPSRAVFPMHSCAESAGHLVKCTF